MKKIPQIIFFFILIITLTACNLINNEESGPGTDGDPGSTVKDSATPYVKGVKNVDVLDSHGSIEGIERMQSFYEGVKNDVPSNIRIVHYTIEGDPLVTDFTYNGESLEVKHDTTRDTYGSGEVVSNRCGNMIKEVNPTNTSYIAIDCNNGRNGMEEMLEISYNMGHQDLFEFELAYGENLEEEISTLTNTIKKENSATESDINRDLVMAPGVKQEVYKRLVFANYLSTKDLDTTCKNKNEINYLLTVHINSAKREFRWNACDQSVDGVKFTNLAKYIIKQTEQKQNKKEDVTVQGYVLERKDNLLLIGEDLNKFDYEWLKDEIRKTDLASFRFDFTELEGVNIDEFNLGDKVQATIEGNVRGTKPGRAKVKEIIKIK